jgi:uncharacterized protein
MITMPLSKKPRTGVGIRGPRKELPAGEFTSWLRRTRSAQVKYTGADVPCGACNACCRSSYFIHIAPGERSTIARIPRALLFAAPLLPKGNLVMGYGENGGCPLLKNGACSIYNDRPHTCRDYDCRIYPAAGIDAGGDGRSPVNRRVRRWKFTYATARGRELHTAVQAAARFVRERAECFPHGKVPDNPSASALLAIKVFGVFLKGKNGSRQRGRVTGKEIAAAIIAASEMFEAKRERRRVSQRTRARS